MKNKGLIFDIQSYSVHDGPGGRTSVFMMGCPLNCPWCANPEGREIKRRLLFRENKCMSETYNCSLCLEKCPSGAITMEKEDNKLKINRSLCRECENLLCTENCFHEALVICGKWITTDEIIKILKRDRNYWGRDGGVTFTGGEPFLQKDFLENILKKCRESFIHTAIETSCYAESDIFLAIMKYIDFAFVDIKHMNSEKHKMFTGVENIKILENISSLAGNNWPGRMISRIPVIKNFNDDRENISNTADFLKKINIKEVNILSFNPLGEGKWRQCGLDYLYNNHKATSVDTLKEIERLFIKKDILCYIDYNTPF